MNQQFINIFLRFKSGATQTIAIPGNNEDALRLHVSMLMRCHDQICELEKPLGAFRWDDVEYFYIKGPKKRKRK